MKSINPNRYKSVFFSIPNTINNRVYKKYMFERRKLVVKNLKFGAVYAFLSKEGDVLYVGKANNVADRVGNHLSYKSELGSLMDYVHYIIFIRDAGVYEETELIEMLDPIFNTKGSDARYSFIKNELISKNPRYKESILRSLILRKRLEQQIISSDVTLYSELETEEEVLTVLSILNDEDLPLLKEV